MSATGRGAERAPCDYYATPAWCVHRLLDHLGEMLLYCGIDWLEPAVGDGAIVRAVDEWSALHWCERPRWTTMDIRPEASPHLCADFTGLGRSLLDRATPEDGFAVAITNPPYDQALPFAQEALHRARAVAMLLRINWLASAERAPWLRAHTPSVYVLPDRPSFTGHGTDATDYAWMVWGGIDTRPTITILDTTPKEARQ